MQFADGYQDPGKYDACIIPGKTTNNADISGALAICGGASGVSEFPLVDASGNSGFGKLLIWRGLSGYLYYSMVLSCAPNGKQYGLIPYSVQSTSTPISFGVWNTNTFSSQYNKVRQ